MLSIESQIRELKELAAKRGIKIQPHDIFAETKSAQAPGRPVFTKIMEDIESGKIHGVLCWQLHRLARNSVDGGRIIWAIKQNNLLVVTPAQTFSEENDNSMMMYIEFGYAQKQIDDLGKGVKRGNRTKLLQGWLPGMAPLGYLNNLREHTIEVDPIRFKLLQKAFNLIASRKCTVSETLETLNKRWGVCWEVGYDQSNKRSASFILTLLT